MKILIVGPDVPYALEASLARCLKERGVEVRIWDNKAVPAIWRGGSWWDLSRVEKAVFDTWASVRFYREAAQWRPDVIFMPKAENIHSYAVHRAVERTGARLVVWYPDHPFKADQTSMNVLRNLKRTTLFYTWGRFLIEPLKSAGCPRPEYLPFAFDPVLYPGDAPISDEERSRYAADLVFVGTWDREREESLRPLADLDLAIWGPGWVEHLDAGHPLARCVRGGALYLGDMVKAFRCAKVCFNQLRLHNGSAHNQRTMEITGVGGGVMLVRRTPEQAAELFTEGREIACFSDPAEMRAQALRLIAMPEPDRRRIAEAAKDRVFREHLWLQRVDRILADLWV